MLVSVELRARAVKSLQLNSAMMEVKTRSNEFEREYIEYLKEKNTELLNRLNHMKETYESKILSKDLNKHYLTSVLENVLNICTVFPQEIDSFFDKMTAAMSALQNILIRKSEMEQLVDKILKGMNPSEMISLNGSNIMQEESLNDRVPKKAETAKVSPMIDGHVISTEPKIYLSRVPIVYTTCQRNEAHQLSPIIEASPDSSPEQSNGDRHIFKNPQIPLERINCNQLSYNYITEESPRRRFKGPKTWKKSLFSNKCQSDNNNRNSLFMNNNENSNKKHSEEGAGFAQLSEDVNPLEGPSWLYSNDSDVNSPSHRFVDYRRRKHRFATLFNNNEECISFEGSKILLEKNSSDLSENHQDSDDEKIDFGSIKKKITDGSEDLFSDSFASEFDESNTSFKKNQSCRRWSAKETNSTNENTERHQSIKNDTLNSSSKNKKSFLHTSEYSGSFAKENNQNSSDLSFQRSKKPNKSSIEISYDRISTKTTPNQYENSVFVKLEDCMIAKETLSTCPKRPSLKKGKVQTRKSERQSRKTLTFTPENKARKKRKAAPSFKLTEPSLNRKLRRN